MALKEFIKINNLQKEINNIFEKVNEGVFGNYKRPAINVSQNNKSVTINVEIKGLNKEDITLKVNHNNLEILGEKKKSSSKENNGNYFEKSSYKGYKASVGLPIHVNIDEINAEYKNDNLRIVIPKMKTKIGNKINIR